jgi:hypothetical protein
MKPTLSGGHSFDESEIVVEAPVTGAACGDQVYLVDIATIGARDAPTLPWIAPPYEERTLSHWHALCTSADLRPQTHPKTASGKIAVGHERTPHGARSVRER